jgi:predicted N-acetyltransferase YhbS
MIDTLTRAPAPAALATPVLAPERRRDAALVEGLIARAFGPGRFAKTAERLREGREPVLDLSFVAWSEGRAVGCVRQWPILIGDVPALLLGPFAVEGDHRRQGLGARLIRRARDAAQEASRNASRGAGRGAILLVGEARFFGPLGFTAEAAGGVTLPGPVDRRRLLALAFGAGPLEGMARAAP